MIAAFFLAVENVGILYLTRYSFQISLEYIIPERDTEAIWLKPAQDDCGDEL